MSTTHNIIYSPQAFLDLSELYKYIRFTLKVPKTAEKHVYRPQKVKPNLTIGGRFFMAKHSFEFKKRVVLEYLDGKGGMAKSSAINIGLDSCLHKNSVAVI